MGEFCIGMLTNQQEAINWFGNGEKSYCHVARQQIPKLSSLPFLKDGCNVLVL